jgi:flagellar biosynthesis protein FliP
MPNTIQQPARRPESQVAVEENFFLHRRGCSCCRLIDPRLRHSFYLGAVDAETDQAQAVAPGPVRRARPVWSCALGVVPLAAVLLVGLMTVPAGAQSVSLNIAPGGSQGFATNVAGILALTTVLALAPGILVMGTAFTRLVVVLSMLRTALGLQNTPPNSVIISLALFLTAFIMQPAFQSAYDNALRPMLDGKITQEQALDRGIKPFRHFMEDNTSDRDLGLFIDLSGWKPAPAKQPAVAPEDSTAGGAPFTHISDQGTAQSIADASEIDDGPVAVPSTKKAQPGSVSRATRDAVPLHVLCAAFLISELSKAFQIGFLLFLPFLVIDIAVSAILMGMGMMMLPPVVVSLPFKLIFFVLVSGWELVAGSLVRSFAG